VLRYITHRLSQLIPVLVFASVLVFLLLRWIPGDPAFILAGSDATPAMIAAVRKEMGLDQPLTMQYAIWALRVVRGDFGKSFISGQPVMSLIKRRLPATVELAVAAAGVAVLMALPLGILAAVRQRSIFDYLVTALNGIALALPNFWLGILLVLLFALKLKWLPSFGWRDPLVNPVIGLKHLVLPAITLSLHLTAVLSRFTRTTVLEVLRQDFVRTARAKGLGEQRMVLHHVLRNALIPVITVLGIQFGQMLGGVVVVEAIFSWPGLGQLILQAVLNRDYTVVQGALLVSVGLFLMINLVTDITYGFIDPRVRLSPRTSR
jgi:peptide/nickel transport system permease protein